MVKLAILELVILTLAVARVTRFITSDTLFKPTREWIMTKEAQWKKGKVGPISLTTLLNCHWCSGIWVAGGMVLVTGLAGNVNWVWYVWTWLAVAQLGAMINEREERVE